MMNSFSISNKLKAVLDGSRLLLNYNGAIIPITPAQIERLSLLCETLTFSTPLDYEDEDYEDEDEEEGWQTDENFINDRFDEEGWS